MTEAKAIRNSVEGRDTPRGPSATQLHARAVVQATGGPAVVLVMECRACCTTGPLHAADCYIARRYGYATVGGAA